MVALLAVVGVGFILIDHGTFDRLIEFKDGLSGDRKVLAQSSTGDLELAGRSRIDMEEFPSPTKDSRRPLLSASPTPRSPSMLSPNKVAPDAPW